MPMNPRESVGPKARPNPTTHHAIAPVIVSRQFLTTIPLQCCLFEAEASTMTKPSCIKKMSAVEAKTQLELAPVLIESRAFNYSAVKGSGAKFLATSDIIAFACILKKPFFITYFELLEL